MITCYECGGKLDASQPYRYMEVLHEKDNPHKMLIYAHERCIVGSPNESHWQNAAKVREEGKE